VFPSLLVFAGSYVHSVKKKSLGQLPQMIGALVIVAAFLLLFFSLAFLRLDLFF
jgi:hypothetical protein